MKYFVRVIKYFVYITVIVTLILTTLVLLKLVSPDINVMFRNGYNSIWQIALAFLGVSAFYPRFGYTNRGVILPGEPAEIRRGIKEYMLDRGYELETENGDDMTFRLISKFKRAAKMWEDRITFSRYLSGYYIEGITKEVTRIASSLEYKYRNPEEN